MQNLLWQRWRQNAFSFMLISIISLLVISCTPGSAASPIIPTPGVTITPTLNPTAIPILTVTSSPTSATVFAPESGLTIHVDLNGTYTISTGTPAWTFSGSVGVPLTHITVNSGSDHMGEYREIQFTYQGKVARSSSIRNYGSHPTVLFSTTYLAASSNTEPFPVFTSYPKKLFHLSYHGSFGIYGFDLNGNDSPWLFFDKNANSLVLSPASHFMIASLHLSSGAISSGINNGIEAFPQGFTQQTMLTTGHSINATMDAWGHSLTDLQNKVRLANDSNLTLNKLGYWTDRGATYYYSYDRTRGYTGTLETAVNDFKRMEISLGYLQLDSWWYNKGNPPTWSNGNGGIYTYTPDPTLFPNGLAAFQKNIGLPLLTHGRWIDAESPYRSQYTISKNVSTDPRYWQKIMRYLRQNGVVTYEQDWLSAQAQSLNNLTDPEAWMTAMANAASQNGLTIQYCMTDPHHFLQSSMYNDVVTSRVSNDHFIRARWDEFLYDSRLASALGLWPWSDVFMSAETNNLLLSTLSAGMVGVGDPLGKESRANLLQSVRPDGVIVKPDSPIVPVDATYLAEAQGQKPAMVAAAYTYRTNMTAAYVFSYSRTVHNTQVASFTPASLGLNSSVYVYNYFTKRGSVLNASEKYSQPVGYNGTYDIVVPIGPSGVAFLGDTSKFVSLGSKRISSLSDDGTVHATIAFASKEGPVTLSGYAPFRPTVTASNGTASPITYNTTTHIFTFTVSAGQNNSASINMSLPTSDEKGEK
ncbi:MAG TPA: hypothetical protein VF458_17350 [Ktedonobacteraceae bacterium]